MSNYVIAKCSTSGNSVIIRAATLREVVEVIGRKSRDIQRGKLWTD
jgi:hypothetical protein